MPWPAPFVIGLPASSSPGPRGQTATNHTRLPTNKYMVSSLSSQSTVLGFNGNRSVTVPKHGHRLPGAPTAGRPVERHSTAVPSQSQPSPSPVGLIPTRQQKSRAP